MSQTIDERVVEMRFDNKEFERGVKETMGTLDKLKAALDRNLGNSAKSFDALDKAANSVSLEGISAGVEALQRRFSTLGIVGMRVIGNITDSLMSMATRTMSYVSDAIVSGGLKRAQNIENAHFQLQALLKDEEAVQAVMDNAMASVDGTAYAYDEAAKAASQFAASGMRAGEEMIGALRGITGVAAMTNSEYEGISRIFTTVAGNGRLMGDQLLQLSSRGLNAAATIADYFREVQGQAHITEADIREMVSDGQISFKTFAAAMDWAFGESAFRANETFTGALSNMRSALARIGAEFFSPLIEQNSDLILLINTVRERINDVKKALTFDEQRSAISGLSKTTNLSTESLENLFNVISERGSVSSDDLEELYKSGVNATKSLTDYINGVTKGTIRTTYATKTAISELTGDLEVNQTQVREFIRNGKIDLKMFTSAMETAYGDQEALSRQFTSTVLNTTKTISAYLKSLDLSKPMSLVYYGVESIKNVFKGLYSVAKPVGKAFSEVFLSFSIDDVISLADTIERLTSKMTISEEASNNLHDAFTGVFSIAKLLIDAFLGLIGVVVPVTKPIGSFTDLLIALAGAMGRGLTSISGWIRNSSKLNKAYRFIATGVQKAMTSIARFIANIDEFADYIYNLPIVQEIIIKIISAFNQLYVKGSTYVRSLIAVMKKFASKMSELVPDEAKLMVNDFIKTIKDLGENLDDLKISDVSELFHKFTNRVKELLDVFKGNTGINVFIENAKRYFNGMSNAFTFDATINNIEKFKQMIGGFISWFKETVSPTFKDFSFGGAAATAGGFGIIYAIIKIAKSLDKVAGTLKAIPDMLGAVRGTLVAYQKNLKADALLKIAKAITLIAISLTVLSFADTDRIFWAASALGLIGVALVTSLGYFSDATRQIPTIETALNTLAKGVKWKAIGSAVKDMAFAIGIIAASIAALTYLYSKDPDNLNKSITLIGEIAAIMIALIAVMSGLGDIIGDGMKAFSSAAKGVLALAASLFIVLLALDKLFKLDIPSDWESRMGLLAAIFTGLAGLTIVVALASRIASKNGFYSSSGNNTVLSTRENGSIAGSIIAVAAALYLSVVALEKLFKINLPSDYKTKFALLSAIFGGLIVAVLAVGAASRLSKGGLKATGTILAMCVAIGTMIGALIVLSFFPAAKLLKGAIALGTTLIALAIALAGAGKIGGKENWKSVLAMALEIGAITVALGVLSMIPIEKLLISAVALGGVLLALATDFLAVSKITDKLAFVSILSMALNVGVIAYSLYVLADQPWQSLLAAGTALAEVLFSVAGAFKIMSNTNVDMDGILTFAAGVISAYVIAWAIEKIADKPWKQLLAAGTAISEVLVAIGGTFAIMSSYHPNWGMVGGFIGGMIALGIISDILKELATYSWENLLGAATSVSEALIALSVALAIVSNVGKLPIEAIGFGILALDAFIANLYLVMSGVGKLHGLIGGSFEQGGEALVKYGDFIGRFIENVISGIGRGIGVDLSSIGQGLSDFVNDAKDFFTFIGSLDEKVLNGAVTLSEAILLFSSATMINGITRFISGGLDFSSFSKQLKTFGKGISNFAKQVKGISGSDVEAASNCALALSGLYSNLPKEDGWMQVILGEQKTLKEFARELIPFGEAMVEYSDVVKGRIDQEAVEASIKAAEVLSAFNDKLPEIGGFVQKIFGEQKTLRQFGIELKSFGKHLVDYCEIVNGKIDQEAVQASIDAAEILRTFNDELPDVGGLVQLLFGHEKTLSEFAEEFVPFGEAIVEYCDIVRGNIDKDAIEASTNAASLLAALQTELGTSDGIIGWFTGGDKDLDSFGKELTKFGKGIASYSESVEGIRTAKLSLVLEEVEKLVKIATQMNYIDTDKMTGFSTALKTMGAKGVSEFIDSFTNVTFEINTAVMDFIGIVSDSLSTNTPTLGAAIILLAQSMMSDFKSQLSESIVKSIGSNIVSFIVNGINNKKESLETDVKTFCEFVILKFNESLPSESFKNIGQNTVQAISTGMYIKQYIVIQTAQLVSSLIVQSFNTNLSPSIFSQIGSYAIDGLTEGIMNKLEDVKKASEEAASQIATTISSTLDVRSPSRVTKKIGEFVSIGLANGILGKINTIRDASEEATGASLDVMNVLTRALSTALDNNPDFEPTIRPVMDMSGLEEDFNHIIDMFNEKVILSGYQKVMEVSGSFSRGSTSSNINSSDENENGEVVKYSFVQNNYSPKPLSRSEIYRQTNNLFSVMKGAVNKQ